MAEQSAPSPRPTPDENPVFARAKGYVGLFISAEKQGRSWLYMAPVDGQRVGDTLRLGDALMERLDARSWRVTVDGEAVVWAAPPAKRGAA